MEFLRIFLEVVFISKIPGGDRKWVIVVCCLIFGDRAEFSEGLCLADLVGGCGRGVRTYLVLQVTINRSILTVVGL